MATTVPPKRGDAYTFEVALVEVADTDKFKVNPTLAAGDVTISKDGGAFGNVDALPSHISDGVLTVALTGTEMTADRVAVLFNDAAGDEWQDLLCTIHTVTTNQLDDVSTFSATATIPDSVSADGSRPTVNQALLEINRFLQERAVSSTTVTVKKEDGSSSAMTFTLDDDTSPTSITRAS